MKEKSYLKILLDFFVALYLYINAVIDYAIYKALKKEK